MEKVKVLVGELHEQAGNGAKAREAYWLLEDKPAAHFRVAATYYGKLAKTKDLEAGRRELSEIVKRFYSPAVSAEALTARAELEAVAMGNTAAAVATLRELVDRFPRQGDFAVKALMRLGALLRIGRKYDEAIVAYNKLILDYPTSGAVRLAWLEIAACHDERKDAQKAVAVLKMLLKKFPHTAEASRAHTLLEQKYQVDDRDVSDN